MLTAESQAPSSVPNLTPEAVARKLGVSRETVNHWLATGKLRSIDVGTSTRAFRRTSPLWLAEFMAATYRPKGGAA